MPPSADPPFEPNQQGVSLDKLAEAFAQVMRAERPPAEEPAAPTAEPAAAAADSGAAEARRRLPGSRSNRPCPRKQPRTTLARSARDRSWKPCFLWAIGTTSRFRPVKRPS